MCVSPFGVLDAVAGLGVLPRTWVAWLGPWVVVLLRLSRLPSPALCAKRALMESGSSAGRCLEVSQISLAPVARDRCTWGEHVSSCFLFLGLLGPCVPSWLNRCCSHVITP